MMARPLPTAYPPHALMCWVDDRFVYIEIPSRTGNPYVEKFDLTEGGLSKALNFLRIRYDELPSSMKNYTAPPIEPSTKNGKAPIQTVAQRELALAVLRKLNVL